MNFATFDSLRERLARIERLGMRMAEVTGPSLTKTQLMIFTGGRDEAVLRDRRRGLTNDRSRAA
jgi:hypothetical protein